MSETKNKPTTQVGDEKEVQSNGIYSFLEKAAAKKGTEYNEDKANQLIEDFDYDYDRMIDSFGKADGIQDLGKFKNHVYSKYKVEPIQEEDRNLKIYSSLERKRNTEKQRISELESQFKATRKEDGDSYTLNITGEDIEIPTYEDGSEETLSERDAINKKLEESRTSLKDYEKRMASQAKLNRDSYGYISETSRDVQTKLKESTDLLNKAINEREKGANYIKGGFGELPMMTTPIYEGDKTSKVNDLRDVRDYYKKINQTLLAPQGKDERLNALGYGLVKTNTGRDFLSLGMNEMKRNLNVKDAFDKYTELREESTLEYDYSPELSDEQNEKKLNELAMSKLNAEEQSLLETFQLFESVQNSSEANFWVGIGSGLQEMLPFIAQFAATGGTATAAGEGVSSLIKNKIASKVVGGLAKTATQSALMTPMTLNNYSERVMPQMEDGELTEGETPIKAALLAYATTFAEVAGENIGELAQGAFRAGAIKRLANNPTTSQKFLNELALKLSPETAVPSIQGGAFELIGEEATGIMQAVIDQDASFFTSDAQKQLLATIALAQGGAVSLNIPARVKYNNNLTNAQTELDDLANTDFTDAVNTATENISDPYELLSTIDNLSVQYDASIDEMRSAKKYTTAKMRVRQMNTSMDVEFQKRIADVSGTDGNITTAIVNGQTWYVQNSENLDNPNAGIVLKDKDGNSLMVKTEDLTDINVQTPEQATTNFKEEIALQEEAASSIAEQEAETDELTEQSGIEIGKTVETPYGKQKVVEVLENTVIVEKPNGTTQEIAISEVSPYKTKEQIEAEKLENEAIEEEPTNQQEINVGTDGDKLSISEYEDGRTVITPVDAEGNTGQPSEYPTIEEAQSFIDEVTQQVPEEVAEEVIPEKTIDDQTPEEQFLSLLSRRKEATAVELMTNKVKAIDKQINTAKKEAAKLESLAEQEAAYEQIESMEDVRDNYSNMIQTVDVRTAREIANAEPAVTLREAILVELSRMGVFGKKLQSNKFNTAEIVEPEVRKKYLSENGLSIDDIIDSIEGDLKGIEFDRQDASNLIFELLNEDRTPTEYLEEFADLKREEARQEVDAAEATISQEQSNDNQISESATPTETEATEEVLAPVESKENQEADPIGKAPTSEAPFRMNENTSVSDKASEDLSRKKSAQHAIDKISKELGLPLVVINSSEASEQVQGSMRRMKDNRLKVISDHINTLDAPQEVKDELIAKAAKSIFSSTGEFTGYYHDGKVYILSDNIKKISELKKTVVHEGIVHYGLKFIFDGGNTMNLRDMREGKDGETIEIKSHEELMQYVYELMTTEQQEAYKSKVSDPTNTSAIADEFLAYMSEDMAFKDIDVNIKAQSKFKALLDDIAKAIRKIFSLTSNQYSTNDLFQDLIIRSKENLQAKAKEGAQMETKEGQDDFRAKSAYHGSPHSFDKFSTDAMGTGEGAQAFGWGLYFTDKKGIAESYANMGIRDYTPNTIKYKKEIDEDYDLSIQGLDFITKHSPVPIKNRTELKREAKRFLKILNEKANSFRSFNKESNENDRNINHIEDLLNLINESKNSDFEFSIEPLKRNLYTVKIHGDKTIEELNFMSWYKSFTKEHQNQIQNQLDSEGIEYKKEGNALKLGEDNKHPLIVNDNNYSIYAELSSFFGSDKAASEFLLKAGIDGIQYPTESLSKGSHEDSFNYVVFDENAVEIEEQVRFRAEDGENFQQWSEGREVLEGGDIQDAKTGEPIVIRAYHGTTHPFTEFKGGEKGNIEGHLGATNYFTSEEGDAEGNYGASGEDLTNRIELRKEQIEYEVDQFEDDGEFDYEAISDEFDVPIEKINTLEDVEDISKAIAENELKGEEEQVFDLFIKLNNPLILGEGSVFIDTIDESELEDYMDDAAEEIAADYGVDVDEAKEDYSQEVKDRAAENAGAEDRVVEAMRLALEGSDIYDKSIHNFLPEYYGGEVDLNQLDADLRASEEFSYSENEDGQLASSQILSDFYEELGYDGVILADVSRRFSNMGLSEEISHIHVPDQYNNQIKLADGSNVDFGEGSDIRFRAEDKNLAPFHNITEFDLMKALDGKGLIAPSIAITNRNSPYTDFGDITLIAPSSMINPQTENVKVFAGDVYSPTIPRPRYHIDKSAIESWGITIVRKAYRNYKGIGNIIENEVSDFGSFYKEIGNNHPNSIIENSKESLGLKLAYLLDNDIPLRVPEKLKDTYLGFNFEVTLTPDEIEQGKAINDKYNKETKASSSDLTDETLKEYQQYVLSVITREMSSRYKSIKEEDVRQEVINGRIEDLYDDVKNRVNVTLYKLSNAFYGTKEMDESALKKRVNNKINKKEYNKWIEDKIDTFQGGKYFEEGNRKVSYSSENLLDHVIGNTRGQEKLMTFGMNKAKSFGIKQFNDIPSIQKLRDTIIPKAEMSEIDDAYKAEYMLLANKLGYKHNDGWSMMDDMGKALADYYKGTSAARALSKNDFSSTIGVDRFKDFASRLKSNPVDYFEAKMQRVVPINEFKAAIVPKGTKKNVTDKLKEAGIKVSKYDKDIEGDRLKKTQNASKSKDIRFRVADSQQELDDFTKDSKVKETVYHGTNAKFTEFDKEKQKIGWIGKGFYFTTSKELADGFGDNLMTSKLNIQNPFIIKGDEVHENGEVIWAEHREGQIKDAYPDFDSSDPDISKILKEKGHDGILHSDVIVVFEPDQILIEPTEDVKFRTIEDVKEYAESILNKEGFKYSFSGSSNTFGNSVYYNITNKNGDDVKVRFSDHSVTNKYRMENEVHFNVNGNGFSKTQSINKLHNAIGNEGYEHGRIDYFNKEGKNIGAYGYSSPNDINRQQEEARKETDTNPSDAQKEAGNYKMGHVKVDGFNISIENPKGSIRSGEDNEGNKWSNTMQADYGYFKGTVGNDKDHIDVFMGENLESDKVYVIDQVNPENGSFDEHKVMMGYNTISDAKRAYRGSYDKNWQGIGGITRTTKQGLKGWFKDGDAKKPYSENNVRFKQTETPEFKGWFGDSKVVDESGKPLVVYHGSDENFDTFDTKRIKYVGNNGDGFYFSPDIDQSQKYGSNVREFYLSFQSPLKPGDTNISENDYKKLLDEIWKDEDYKYDLMNYGQFKESEFGKFRDAKAKEFFEMKDDYRAVFDLTTTATGSVRYVSEKLNNATGKTFDSVWSPDFREYVAFEPTQIKSATGNDGSFSKENDDIRFAVGGESLEDFMKRVTESNPAFIKAQERYQQKAEETPRTQKEIVTTRAKIKAKIRDIKQGTKIGARDERKRIKDIQNLVIQYAKAHTNLGEAGAREVGRVVTIVKNTNDIKKIEKAFTDINDLGKEVAERSQVKKDVTAINKLVKQITTPKKQGAKKVAKFTYDYNKEFDRIKDAEKGAKALVSIVNSKKDKDGNVKATPEQKEAALESLNKMIADHSEKSEENPNGKDSPNVVDNVIAKLIDLRMKGSKASPAMVTQIRSELEYIKELANDEKKAQDKDNWEMISQEKNFVMDLVKGEDLESKSKLKQMSQRRRNQLLDSTGNWESILTELGGLKLRDKYSLIANEIAQEVGVQESMNKLLDEAMEIYGLESRNKMLGLITEMSKEDFATIPQPFERGSKRLGKDVKLSKMHIIDIYNAIQQPQIKEDYYGTYGQDIVDALVKKLTPQDIKFAESMGDIVRGYHDKVNPVFIKLTNRDLPKNKNYWMSTADREGFVDVLADHIEFSAMPSFIKERAGRRVPKVANAFDKFSNHIVQSEWYANMAEDLTTMNKVFKDVNVKNMINDSKGEIKTKKPFSSMIEENLKSEDLNSTTDNTTAYEAKYGSLLNNWITAKIGLNPSVFVKQLGSMINYSENMPMVKWAAQTIKNVASPQWGKTVRYMMTNSPYLKARFKGGYSEAMQYAMDAHSSIPKAKSAFQNTKNAFTILTRIGDMGAIIFGGKAYVDHLMKTKGMTEKEAFKQFELDTLRSQQSPLQSTLSKMQKEKSPFKRSLFTFANTPSQYMRKMYEANAAYRHGDISKAQLTKTYFIYGVANQLAYIGAGTLMAAAMGAGMPDEDEFLKSLVIQIAMSPLAGIPVVRNIADPAAREALGLHVFDQEMPVTQQLINISKNVSDYFSADTDEKRDKALKKFGITFSEMFGAPTYNVTKVYNATINREEFSGEKKLDKMDDTIRDDAKEKTSSKGKQAYDLKVLYSSEKTRATKDRKAGKDFQADRRDRYVKESKLRLSKSDYSKADYKREYKKLKERSDMMK